MKGLTRTQLFAFPLALLLTAGCQESGDAPAGKAPETADTTQAANTDGTAAPAKTGEAKPEATGTEVAKADPGEGEDDAKDEGDKDEPGTTATAAVAANSPTKDDGATPSATAAATATTGDKPAPTGPQVGKQSTVTASATADSGFKCNPEYPIKFKPAGGSNATYPQALVRGGCSSKMVAAVTVPYVPQAAGPGAVAGTLKYGICDAENCKILSKQMSLAFNASE